MGVPVSIAYFFLFLAWPSLQPQLNAWQQWGLGYLPMVWYILAAAFAAVRIFGLRGSRAVAAVASPIALWGAGRRAVGPAPSQSGGGQCLS